MIQFSPEWYRSELAHMRARMLGSDAFPADAHLAFLERDTRVLAPLGAHPVGDWVLRDVHVGVEWTEAVRVVSTASTIPRTLLRAGLTWFGLAHGDRLLMLHGGFFWNERLWVRRVHTLADEAKPAHEAIEARIVGHLWAQGMREMLVLLPSTSDAAAQRRLHGWADSAHATFDNTEQVFVWLQKAFPGRPTLGPAWRWTDGALTVREAADADIPVVLAAATAAWAAQSEPQSGARVAAFLTGAWPDPGTAVLIGEVDGSPVRSYGIRRAGATASFFGIHPPGGSVHSPAFWYAALTWARAVGFTHVQSFVRSDCGAKNALLRAAVDAGGQLQLTPRGERIQATFPVAAALTRDLAAYQAAARGWLTEAPDPAIFADVPPSVREKLGMPS